MLNRSTSFRPRPIDINQKLPVFVGDAANGLNSPSLDSSSAPSTPDLGGGRRRRGAKPIEPLDIEAVMEECAAAEEPSIVKPQEVATPSFRTTDDVEYQDEPQNPWKRPAKYIHFEEKSVAAREKSTEYDLDSEDESFRSELNTQLKNKTILNENTFEKLIDTFEKEFFRQFKGKGLLTSVWDSEEDFKCSVCNRASTEANNPIIFCDTCDMTTHVECYGLQNTPRGSWFCTKCKSKDQLEVSCVLCTERGGAFKRTKDGEWAHLSCAMWLMEKDDVLSPTNLKSTFVIDTSLVPREKRDLLCHICNRSLGGCVKCSQADCHINYHITCAMRMGFFAEIKNPKKGASFKSFCKKHSALYCERKKESQKTKRRMEEEKLMGEEYTQLVPAATLAARNLGRLKKEVIQDVYKYWKKKRLAEGKPLIGRLQIEEDEIRHSASYKQEREYTEMRKIRQGMEIARLLLDLVGKRERLKQRQFSIMQDLFEEQLLLGNELLEYPKPARGKGKATPAPQRKAETSRRKSTGGSVKATMQQEVEEAVKKTSTTSRRKSSALTTISRKHEIGEAGRGDALEEANSATPKSDSASSKRPRATKKRRHSDLVIDIVSVSENTNAEPESEKFRTTQKRISEEAKHASVDSAVTQRAALKRKREEQSSRDDKPAGDKEDDPPHVEEKVKRLAKRKRRSNPSVYEKGDGNGSDEATHGTSVHNIGAASKGHDEIETEDTEETKEGESDKDEEDSDQDYTKGNRKRLRKRFNEVTDQRVTRAQSKRVSNASDDMSVRDAKGEQPPTPKSNKQSSVPVPSGKSAGRRKNGTTNVSSALTTDLSDDDNGENVSDEENYSPSTSPDSSPDRRSSKDKDGDGPVVLKKQTKINGFFPVVKKAEKKATSVARKRRRSGEQEVNADKSGDDSADGEDVEVVAVEVVDDRALDDGEQRGNGTGRKKRKAKRTSGGGTRRSPAQKLATAAAAAAAAAARRPLQAKKNR